jgi:hypothetical protein
MIKSVTLAVTMLSALASAASAMEVRPLGDQLILTGPVVGDEYDTVVGLLDAHSEISTIILRNSPGGDAPTGFRLGALFRARGLRTAVSGFCFSSCSRMFLGGKERAFTDDFPPGYTQVGFHGHYGRGGVLNAAAVRRSGLKEWIIKYSDGKADAALVERWINIPRANGVIRFFNPGLMNLNGISTFMCQGNESGGHGLSACERIAKSAIDLGVATSLTLVHSNDQDAVRATLPAKPPQSGFAAIDDETKVPLSSKGIAAYHRFLAAPAPRAFAIAPDGSASGWASGPLDAMQRALERCAQRAGQTCRLYAVDDEVVWTPNG